MAIYHLRLKLHSRGASKGIARRSVVASAAYRSGERLFDIAQGVWYAYQKPDVVHTEILCPEMPNVPDWVFNRQELWNRVEASEKRTDAQLAREIELTLPRELSKDQQIHLVRRFVKEHFVSQGMVADIAIHCPIGADGAPQPHAHCLLLLRRLNDNTPTGLSLHKERDWNEREDVAREVAEARKRFNNTGLDADKEALEAAEQKRNVHIWRREWANSANRALADVGSEARIDHRTLEKQGILRVPQVFLGVARHIENAYDHVKQRVTQWISIRKRGELYADAERLAARSPTELAAFILKLGEIAEAFTKQFRQPPKGKPEVNHDR